MPRSGGELEPCAHGAGGGRGSFLRGRQQQPCHQQPQPPASHSLRDGEAQLVAQRLEPPTDPKDALCVCLSVPIFLPGSSGPRHLIRAQDGGENFPQRSPTLEVEPPISKKQTPPHTGDPHEKGRKPRAWEKKEPFRDKALPLPALLTPSPGGRHALLPRQCPPRPAEP